MFKALSNTACAASAEGGPTQKTGIGLGIVRVYNPYMNREEVYDWDAFAGAFENTRGNPSENLTVVAPCNNP